MEIINNYVNEFRTELVEVLEVENVQTTLEKYLALVDEVAKVDIAEYRLQAITNIETLYEPLDYSEEVMVTIQAMIQTLENAINNAEYYTEIDQLCMTFATEVNALDKVQRTAVLEIERLEGYNGTYFNLVIKNGNFTTANRNQCKFTLMDLNTNIVHNGVIHHLPSNVWAQIFFQTYNQTATGNFILTITIPVENITYTCEIICINGQQTTFDTIRATKLAEVNNMLAKLDMIESMYETADWESIQNYLVVATQAINDATTYGEMLTIIAELETNLLSVPVKEIDIQEKIAIAIAQIDAYIETLDQTKYEEENWNAILTLVTDAKTALATMETEEAIDTLVAELKQNIQNIETIKTIVELEITEIHAYTPNFMHIRTVNYDVKKTDNLLIYLIDANSGTRYSGILFNYIANWSQYHFSSYTGLQNGQYDLYLEVTVGDIIYKGSIYVNAGKIETLESFKASKLSEVTNYFTKNGIIEVDYTVENWTLLQGYVTTAIAEITEATEKTTINEIVNKFIEDVTAVPLREKTLEEIVAAAKLTLEQYKNAKNKEYYSAENYAKIEGLLLEGKTALDLCESEEDVNTTLELYKSKIDEVEMNKLTMELTVSNFNPHGGRWIAIAWSNQGVLVANGTNFSLTVTLSDGSTYQAEVDRNDGEMAKFFHVTSAPSGFDVEQATYKIHMQFEIGDTIYYTDINVVNGKIQK